MQEPEPINKEKIQKRFDELEKQYTEITFFVGGTFSSNYADNEPGQQWATSAQHLIKAVFTGESPHYNNFTVTYERDMGGVLSAYDLQGLGGIFRSAKADYEGGYIFNLESRISGELLGDFVVMAKEALRKDYKDVATVLACAALEDTLKRFAASNGLETTDKKMPEIINSLKSKGLVGGPQKALLGSFPKIRNAALHAEWDKLSEPEVNSVIGFVEQFLLSHFGER